MPLPLTDPTKPPNPSLGSRLDSWKEIAAYLCRGERTVKRWETDRGLPIHRVPGGGRGSVYAFSAELDEWLSSSGSSEAETAEPDAAVDQQEIDSVSDARPPDLALASSERADLAPAEPVPAAAQLEPPSKSPENRNSRWLLAGVALLLVGVATGVVWVSALEGGGFPSAERIRSLLAGGGGKLNPVKGSAVSERDRTQAHALYLKVRYEWGQRTPDSLNRALDSFTQAIVHDPGYAEAYVGLADTYDLLREYSTMTDSDAYARAIVAAKKAVELDDSLPEAHRALAFAERYGALDFVDSRKEFERAIQLSPNDGVARRWYANAFAVQGRFDLSLAEMNKARELDPASNATLSDLGILLFNAGKRDEGIALLKEVERSAPEYNSAHRYLMRIGLETRNFPMYLAEGEKTAELSDDPSLKDVVASAKAGYKSDGQRGLLAAVYAKQKEYSGEGKISKVHLAITCATMGRRQEALQILEDAFAGRDPNVAGAVLADPVLLTLKDEPRYKALVKKINFPPPASASPTTSLAMDSARNQASH